MEEILQDCGKLEQIGKSNNSVIYSLLDKEGKSTGKALKLVMHNAPNVHSKECEHLQNEGKLLDEMRHPNIIKNQGKILTNVSIKNSHFCAQQIELADTDFFDKIAKMYPNPVEPKYIRQAFLQVLQGMDYLHNEMNVAHNDMKLENIFLFKNKVKIADFGFAANQFERQYQSTEDQYQLWKNRCKTPLAPETLDLIAEKEEKFDEKKADIFALGVSLFQALFLRAPFFSEEFASRKDTAFKHMFSGQKNKFWENEELQNTLKYLNQFEDFRQEAFVDLVNKMLEVDPEKRITVKQIIKHPWFKQVQNAQQGKNLSNCTQF